MQIRVLGSSGAEMPGYTLSSFLLDGTLLLDAGSVTQSLSLHEQKDIKNVLLTHSHLDHIKDLAFLADNLVLENHFSTVNIYALADTIRIIKQHIFNDIIWPDFTKIPSTKEPLLRFIPVEPLRAFKINRYRILPLPVEHSVPAVGYLIESDSTVIAYTGDTGPSDALCKALEGIKLNVFIVEVSFPDELCAMAIKTGHLCPQLLKELIKSKRIYCDRILITHIKPQYEDIITQQLNSLISFPFEILDSPRIIEVP